MTIAVIYIRVSSDRQAQFLRRLEEKKQYIGVEALILGGQKSGFRRDQHDFGIRLLLPEGTPR